jgi:hypothetical protein
LNHYPVNALLDGGIYHSKLGFTYVNNVLSGSWSSQAEQKEHQYWETRNSSISTSGFSVNVSV